MPDHDQLNTSRIPLSGQLGRGSFALVDDDDYDRVMGLSHRWNLAGGGVHGRYARVTFAKGSAILMHRFILGAAPQQMMDHINGDGLDNRKTNLRFCNHSQNAVNRAAREGRDFKGITQNRKTKRWRAGLRIKGKVTWLGYFTSPELAALAYDHAAIEHQGVFARLNFPHGGVTSPTSKPRYA